MRIRKEHQREATRIERVASSLSGAMLRDYLRTYANSLAAATDILIRDGQILALDTIEDNAECALAIARELRSRNLESFVDPPNEKLQSLVAKYMAKKGVLPTEG